MESPDSRRRIDWAGVAIAAVLGLVAGVLALDVSNLQLSPAYGLGPRSAVVIVAVGLAVLALGNLYNALTGGVPEREEYDPRAIVLILGGLAAFIALLAVGGGFIPGVVILFVATAAAFGNKNILLDFAIGTALAFGAYLLFSKLLSLSLPMGPIERLL